MKHIKNFESFAIKHTDEISTNHILRDFSRKLEDIIITIKEKDNFNHSSVKRYFYNDGYIKILYNSTGRDKLMKTQMYNDNDNIFINIALYKQWFDKYNNSEGVEFYNFICKIFKKYKYNWLTEKNPNCIKNSGFKIPLIEKESAINKIYEYKIKIDSEKYNL